MASFEQIIKSPPGVPLGGARRPAEPQRLAEDGSPYLFDSPYHLKEKRRNEQIKSCML